LDGIELLALAGSMLHGRPNSAKQRRNRVSKMSNRAIWNVRLRHEWLRKPLKPKRLKRRKRWRIGLEQALQRKAQAESDQAQAQS
jgi:hypothetical protein